MPEKGRPLPSDPVRPYTPGTFTWADGSYFDGYWRAGEKHGVGIWCPPPPGSEAGRRAHRSDGYGSPPRGAEGGFPRAKSEDAGSPKGADGGGPGEVMLREYDNGTLVREEAVPETERPKGDPVAGPPAKKTRKKREVVMGETIYKGAPSYDLMLQLQLGIRWSVGRVTPEPNRNLTERDFTDKTPESAVSTRFPRRGSSSTPPHAAHDFKWKDYCPMARARGRPLVSCLSARELSPVGLSHVSRGSRRGACAADRRSPAPVQVFRKLRERFGIDAGDYMLSLCGAPGGQPSCLLISRLPASRSPSPHLHPHTPRRSPPRRRTPAACVPERRRPSAAGAVVAGQVRVRLLPEPGRPLHRQDDAQGRDGAHRPLFCSTAPAAAA